MRNPFVRSLFEFDPDFRATPGYRSLQSRAAEGDPCAQEALRDVDRWLWLPPL